LLEETGVISDYGIILSYAMFDAESVFGWLLSDGSQDEEDFVSIIGEHAAVSAASSYSDGHYALIAGHTTSEELLEFGAYLRGLEGIVEVDLFPIVGIEGGKIELKSLHLRVLRSLLEDPRMPVVDIAEKAGLTARRVRRILQEMIDSSAVYVTTFPELGASQDIAYMIELRWDESMKTYQEVIDWLIAKFPVNHWQDFVSALEPRMFTLFATEQLTELDNIVRTIRKEDFIKTAKVTVSTHHEYFKDFRYKSMLKMIEEAVND
jgi:DNA-binding Lrp family transcriptional regulator